ncbi:hypothetical protein ACM66B_005334 [Microbotryomycetes sp. NB124-2]
MAQDERRERELWHALELGNAPAPIQTSHARNDSDLSSSDYGITSPDDSYELKPAIEHARGDQSQRRQKRFAIGSAAAFDSKRWTKLSFDSLKRGSSGLPTPQSATPPTTNVEFAAVTPDALRLNRALSHFAQLKRPKWLGKFLLYMRGPSPAVIEKQVKPWLPKTEAWLDKRLEPVQRRRRLVTPLFLFAWLLGFIFLVRASFFTSSTNVGTPTFIVADTSYWYRNDECGMNGTSCAPFSNYTFTFRCPSQTLSVELLNNRAVGDQLLVYQSLVVGGMDDLATYRADSWICPSAIHHGLFGNKKGGCGQLQLVGEFTGYQGGERNGVKSVSFDSTFPSSYRFIDEVNQSGCQDLRDEILGYNVAMSTVFSFFIRPAPQAFFWTLFCLGFWHIVLVSDPSAMPPDISTGFGNFLPALFVGESFWRHSWRWVTPAFEFALLEKTIWYLAGFWFGTLFNISLDWIPLQRLTAADIQKQPGGLVAVILLVLFLVACIINQIRVIRRTGWFYFYLFWYCVGGGVLAVLGSALPGLEFRMHHYIAAICLIPGCAFVTRPSAIFQGFLLGMFLNGVGRWGFDSILQTVGELQGDAALGSDLPTWLTSATNFTQSQTTIWWNDIPSNISASWNGFALLVDDVLRYTGTSTNFSMSALDSFDETVPHYFRLAYQQDGTSGDFTRAAVAFFNNGTWLDAPAGPS